MHKKLSLLIPAIAVLMLFTTACKKDSKSPQELILGKWTFKTLTTKEVNGGVVSEESEDMSTEGYFLDFKSDGTVKAYVWGGEQTMNYTLKDAKTLIIGGETITLSTLTEKKFIAYSKQTDTDYVYEQWMEFVK